MGRKFYPIGGKFSAEYFIWREWDLFPGGIIFLPGRWTVPTLSCYTHCNIVYNRKVNTLSLSLFLDGILSQVLNKTVAFLSPRKASLLFKSWDKILCKESKSESVVLLRVEVWKMQSPETEKDFSSARVFQTSQKWVMLQRGSPSPPESPSGGLICIKDMSSQL